MSCRNILVIFYCGCWKIINGLESNGIPSIGYHGKMDVSSRENPFMSNIVQVIVATRAFGMGIDKPESMASWAQELGRGDRDGEQAHATKLTKIVVSVFCLVF